MSSSNEVSMEDRGPQQSSGEAQSPLLNQFSNDASESAGSTSAQDVQKPPSHIPHHELNPTSEASIPPQTDVQALTYKSHDKEPSKEPQVPDSSQHLESLPKAASEKPVRQEAPIGASAESNASDLGQAQDSIPPESVHSSNPAQPDPSNDSKKVIEQFGEPPPSSQQQLGDSDDLQKSPNEPHEEAKPEIQTIIEQFKDKGDGEPLQKVDTPVRNSLPVFQYPPRSSSLLHRRNEAPAVAHESGNEKSEFPDGSEASIAIPRRSETSFPSQTSPTVTQPPLPAPDPEPDLPFDFHRFLEQLRHKSADPVARFLRSFLVEFGKKQWMVHEQVKIISDFLVFIANKMAQSEVWRHVSDAEFDNAREGMEKLVMNRLYSQTFSPEIPVTDPSKNRKNRAAQSANAGRRGQHQEDVERDDILSQKVRIYSWVKEDHLDMKPFRGKDRKFQTLAQQELAKITSYRAPRDKVICVLNCCKVLFGFLRHAECEQSADSFIPLLIYTVLKTNPSHLVSNVQFILRFRNQDKLNGEAGYYMSSLMGAIQFIENLDRTSLTISDEEFEAFVESAVSAMVERDEKEGKRPSPATHIHLSEKSTPSRPEVTPRHSLEGEQVHSRSAHRRFQSSNGTRDSKDSEDDGQAVKGLLRSIQKPLSSIGRIFSDDSGEAGRLENQGSLVQQSAAASAGSLMAQKPSNKTTQSTAAAVVSPDPQGEMQRLAIDDAAVRQASVETAKAHSLQRREHQTVVETLCGMFPDLDKEVIGDVVRTKDGRVGLAVDACLALGR